jgi:hypothetical protein
VDLAAETTVARAAEPGRGAMKLRLTAPTPRLRASGGALLLLAGFAAACGEERRPAEPAPVARPAPVRPSTPAPRSAGRAVPAGDSAAVAAAHDFLAPPVRTEPCGPYRLMTDADAPLLETLRALCAAPVSGFEEAYAARLGVRPAHPPRGTLVVFADRRRFRRYVAAHVDLPQGYAAFSLAPKGLVVLPGGDLPPEEIARTLVHELAHLAHRRTFGVDLEPWLSEGLADAVGDSASPGGFAPLAGFVGVEGLRERLLGGYASGHAGTLERLVTLGRDRFDRGAVAHDYEQAALVVRFLLLDPELVPAFRAWLAGRARPGAGGAAFPPQDGPGWGEIEGRFRGWLAAR